MIISLFSRPLILFYLGRIREFLFLGDRGNEINWTDTPLSKEQLLKINGSKLFTHLTHFAGVNSLQVLDQLKELELAESDQLLIEWLVCSDCMAASRQCPGCLQLNSQVIWFGLH